MVRCFADKKVPRIYLLAFSAMMAMAPARVLALVAQETSAPAPERAFIVNAGGDFGVGAIEVAEGEVADRAYSEFFFGMKTWGRYELVDNPARADWILEISLSNHQTCVIADPQTCLESRRSGHVSYCLRNDYRLELVMMDAKTFGARKHFVEHLKEAGYFSDPEKLFDKAVSA